MGMRVQDMGEDTKGEMWKARAQRVKGHKTWVWRCKGWKGHKTWAQRQSWTHLWSLWTALDTSTNSLIHRQPLTCPLDTSVDSFGHIYRHVHGCCIRVPGRCRQATSWNSHCLIIEYLTDWLFAGLLSAEFLRCQKVHESLKQRIFGILTHQLAWRYQYLSYLEKKLTFFGQWPSSYGCSTNFQFLSQGINHPFTALRVGDRDVMSIGDL